MEMAMETETDVGRGEAPPPVAWRAIGAYAAYVAAGAALVAMALPPARGQGEPPPKPLPTCRAVLGAAPVVVGPRSERWIETSPANNLRPSLGYFLEKWAWKLTFSCDDTSRVSACRVCSRVQVDRQNPATKKWVVATIVNSPFMSLHVCGATYQVSYTTALALPYAGTVVEAIWSVAAWDPGLSADCFGQDYDEVYSQMWKTPPHP